MSIVSTHDGTDIFYTHKRQLGADLLEFLNLLTGRTAHAAHHVHA